MIDKDSVLKRLVKGVNPKRADLDTVHIKGTYAEIGREEMIIREKISDTPLPEEVLSRKDLKPTPKPYPDTDRLVNPAKAKPTIFKMAFKKEVFELFVKILPDDVTDVVFEIKGAEDPLVISCGNMEGLLMPMQIKHNHEVQEVPGPTAPEKTKKVVKIVIENGEIVAVEGLPEGYTHEVVKK